MKLDNVKKQLDEVYSRAIRAGVSVKQNFPVIKHRAIGELRASAVALKDIPYRDIYTDLERNNQYHLKLPDGALMIFQYSFDEHLELSKHRLAYFPNPTLPSPEEAPDLYKRDDLYADILLHRIVRFPIRFDYDPSSYKPTFHAHSHMTLGQFDNCRIPASHPLPPYAFLAFVLRNFYYQIYRKHQNIFEKRIPICDAIECITPQEKRITNLVIGL